MMKIKMMKIKMMITRMMITRMMMMMMMKIKIKEQEMVIQMNDLLDMKSIFIITLFYLLNVLA